jgi:hypothetical protein
MSEPEEDTRRLSLDKFEPAALSFTKRGRLPSSHFADMHAARRRKTGHTLLFGDGLTLQQEDP